MRAKTILLPVLTALLIIVAGGAFSSQAVAAGPAIDQYVETLPDSGGDRPSGNGVDPSSSSTSSGETGSSTAPAATSTAPSVSSAQLSKLRSSGSDGGAAAAAIVAISGGATSGAGDVPDAEGSKGDDLDHASGDTALAGALKILLAGGPGGLALPAILITVLGGGIVVAARRRNGSHDGV